MTVQDLLVNLDSHTLYLLEQYTFRSHGRIELVASPLCNFIISKCNKYSTGIAGGDFKYHPLRGIW